MQEWVDGTPQPEAARKVLRSLIILASVRVRSAAAMRGHPVSSGHQPSRADRVLLQDLRLPSLPSADFLTAYSVCGGYPLHLDQWDQAADVETNLRRLAYQPAGLLVRDALDIIGEDLDWRGGYERVLTAIGFGARRRSRIAGRAQQRIDYTLERLRRAGYVRRTVPSGASPRTPCTRSPTPTWPSGSVCSAMTWTSLKAGRGRPSASGRPRALTSTWRGYSRARAATTPHCSPGTENSPAT